MDSILRNWKTASPQRNLRTHSVRELLRVKKGIGRALAELENSKSLDSAPENLLTQSGRKLLCERKGTGKGFAVLE